MKLWIFLTDVALIVLIIQLWFIKNDLKWEIRELKWRIDDLQKNKEE